MIVAIFSMALGFTSCGEDDVVDFVCDAVEEELRVDVDAAFADWQAEDTPATCSALKDAIDAFRASDCGSADAYAAQRDALPEDCSANVSGTCVTCTAQGVGIEICEGSNGNAFVAGIDTEIGYSAYVSALQASGSTCN